MKRYLKTLIVLLGFTLAFGLSACQANETTTPETDQPEVSTLPPETGQPEPSTLPPETDQTEPSTLPSEQTEAPEPTEPPPTALSVDPDFQVLREPEEVRTYPFTLTELSAASDVVMERLDAQASEKGVLTFEMERMAYDPMATDLDIRRLIATAPVPGWTEDDYYAHCISFAVIYSATHDHKKSPVPDADHEVQTFTLTREQPDAPWVYVTHGFSGEPYRIETWEPYAKYIMTGEELAQISNPDENILAGFKIEDEYWLYLWDDSTGQSQFVRRSA